MLAIAIVVAARRDSLLLVNSRLTDVEFGFTSRIVVSTSVPPRTPFATWGRTASKSFSRFGGLCPKADVAKNNNIPIIAIVLIIILLPRTDKRTADR